MPRGVCSGIPSVLSNRPRWHPERLSQELPTPPSRMSAGWRGRCVLNEEDKGEPSLAEDLHSSTGIDCNTGSECAARERRRGKERERRRDGDDEERAAATSSCARLAPCAPFVREV